MDHSDGDDDLPSNYWLGVSSQAYRGFWTVDRPSGQRFLPIFMVSGHLVDFFPAKPTVRVACQRYDVEHHLPLCRSQAARDVMEEFAAEFSILADTQFAEFIRGGEPVILDKLLQMYRDMSSQKAGKAP